MIYSYTQISQYLRCPRSYRYRYRYLDGWTDKDTRAAVAFGRCFENALAAYFRGDDCTEVFFNQWQRYRETPLGFGKTGTWDKFLHEGIQLLHLFAQEGRVQVRLPQRDLQLKAVRSLPSGGEFVSYIDAIGYLDGNKCLIDWKTTSSRYPDEPQGLLSLDPQLICYSWMSGIRDVALIVFVRKRLAEIQYLKSSITDEQCEEFNRLVESAVGQIEAAHFPPHSGIRFPMNGCMGCSHLGLCLGNQSLIDKHLVRRPGANELEWLDQLVD
jgi:PD-(D/E)XK nuclease superfamily